LLGQEFACRRLVQQLGVTGIRRGQRAAGSGGKQRIDVGGRGRVVADRRPATAGHRPNRRGAVRRQDVVVGPNGQPCGAVGAVANDQVARGGDGRQSVKRCASRCLASATVQNRQSRS